MNTKLITALKTAAKALENGTFDYNWSRPSTCNCGVLVCSILGKSAATLAREIPRPLYDKHPNWKVLVSQYCPVTGIPENEIFRELFQCGLVQSDIIHLEALSDPAVIARVDFAGIQPSQSKRKWYQFRAPESRPVATLDYLKAKHAAVYMRAWASLLEDEGAMDGAKVERETQAAQ